MRRKANRTSIAMARRMWASATGLTAIVRMAEIVVAAAEGRAAGDEIEGAVGGAGDLVVAGAIADAAGRAGEDTKSYLPRIFADSHG